MRKKVVKRVCIFAVMLAVLVSTVAFSASAFSFNPDSGYTSSFVLINNASSAGLPSTGNIVLAILGNVKITPANGQYASRTVSSARLVWYASSGNLVLDINDSSYAYLASAASNSSVVNYYPTNNNPVSVSYVKVSYNTISNVNSNFQKVILASADQYYDEGFAEGSAEGYDDGYDVGYNQGFQEGASADYEAGFDAGYAEAEQVLGSQKNVSIFENAQMNIIVYTSPDAIESFTIQNTYFAVDGNSVDLSVVNQDVANYMVRNGITDPIYSIDVSFVWTGSAAFTWSSPIYLNSSIAEDTQVQVGYFNDYPDESVNPVVGRQINGRYGWSQGNDLIVYQLSFIFRLTSYNGLVLSTDMTVPSSGYNEGYYVGLNAGLAGGGQQYVDDAYNRGYAEGENKGFIDGKAEGISLNATGDFRRLIFAVVDAPINMLRSMLNFEILGYNLFGFITGLFTLCLVGILIKRIF